MMQNQQIDGLINAFPCLADISLEDWQNAGISLVELPVNLIVPEGQILDSASFVVDGTIRIYRLSGSGREVTLYRVRRGECCPLMALSILGETEYEGSTSVEEPTRALKIPADTFQNWTGKYIHFRDFIFSTITQRIVTMSEIIDKLAFKSIRTRISEFLIENTGISKDTLRITHDQLAIELGTTREVISRSLKVMERDGLIKLSRGEIQRIDRERLLSLDDYVPG